MSDDQSHPMTRLGEAPKGFIGTIMAITPDANHIGALGADEMERRLLEMGFVEGARVEVRYLGPVGGDPIAVQVDHSLIALRRVDANAIYVQAKA